MADRLSSAPIIAEVEALGTTLEALGRTHRAASLATLEHALLAAVRAALPGLLTAVLEVASRALQTPAVDWRQPCPRCGRRIGLASWRPRTVQTVCGAITWQRPWYHCRPCGHGFSPADTCLGLAPRSRLSAGLHAWVIRLGATTSFGEAAELLQELSGLAVSAETIRQHTEATGADLEAALVAQSAEVARTQEAAAPLDPAPGQLVVEADGVMVRYRDGWHEVKLGVVAGLVDGELRAPSYLAARASPAAFGPRLVAEAARRGALEEIGWAGPPTRRALAILPTVVVLGDGAPWIWHLAAEHFGTRTEIVDFYHASEHLWSVARALYGDGTAAATAWADAQIHALRTQGGAPVRAALAAARAPTAEGQEVLRRERGYFHTNAARMAYPEFHARGLPIGSGAIESAAKHVVQLRLKRPGCRWSEPGAQAVLNVRCRLRSALPLAA
jgi:Uncharacterised protein family (UPF0236)